MFLFLFEIFSFNSSLTNLGVRIKESSFFLLIHLCCHGVSQGKVEIKNKGSCLSFWMDPLSLCSHMKIEREIGCWLEMSLGGMLLTILDLISMF